MLIRNKRKLFFGIISYVVAIICFINASIVDETRALFIGLGICLTLLGTISFTKKDQMFKK